MRRRVPVELVPTAIEFFRPMKRDGQALEARVLACQEAEVRLLTGPGREHPLVYRLLDGLSELRLSGFSGPKLDGTGAQDSLTLPF